jgi:hypothetical protein
MKVRHQNRGRVRCYRQRVQRELHRWKEGELRNLVQDRQQRENGFDVEEKTQRGKPVSGPLIVWHDGRNPPPVSSDAIRWDGVGEELVQLCGLLLGCDCIILLVYLCLLYANQLTSRHAANTTVLTTTERYAPRKSGPLQKFT